jgi:ABC-2 type transport system permease protein
MSVNYEKRFGTINWLGLFTLVLRERKRFSSVWTQTLLAPIVTSILFLSIFSLVLSSRKVGFEAHSYTIFMAPGILMMTVIQNSFANTSSSILISKVQGNIVDTLMPPLSPLEMTLGYMIGGMLRGIFVAIAVVLVIFPFIGLSPERPLIMILFVCVASSELALLGIVAGIISQKFDHMQALTNFVITPLSFLSGTFYSIKALPPFFEKLSSYNPIFFLIDGVRFGALGYSDGDIVFNLVGSLVICLLLILLCVHWFSIGYKLRN